MHKTAFAIAILGVALPASAQTTISRDQIWQDTVKRGNMAINVHGLGAITGAGTAAIKVAESQAGEVRIGQSVSIDTRQQTSLSGKVSGIQPPVEGTVPVSVEFVPGSSPVPQAGTQVDATFHIGGLSDVVYVGRPVFGKANSQVMLFKLDPGGQSCTRVRVRFGQTSVNQIQIMEGLQPGDRVILSDMSAYDGVSRLTLR